MGFTVGIDIGGTFTDTVVMDESGAVTNYKTPTTPASLIDGLLANLEEAASQEGLKLLDFIRLIDRVGHGTTVATNAFIERRGSPLALLTTRGFEDTIFAQRMMGMTAGLSRTEVTDYSRRSVPEPLVPPNLVFGVRERIDYKGEEIAPLREEDVADAVNAMGEAEVDSVAICFLWSFRNPEHEHRAAEIVREQMPEAYISTSSDTAPRIGEYERTATTLVNAYLGPLVANYVSTLEQRLAANGEAPHIVLLDSSGGVVTVEEAANQPVRLMLSGPSGGLTASEYVGTATGDRNIVTFDMGGTSTDVGLIIDGSSVSRHETEVGKYHLQVPMADITAIGAGGGSIARVEEGRYLRVGPESAGAVPGPVCYGRGGTEPTVTDADVVLGILDPDRFLGGRLRLSVGAAETAIQTRIAEPLGMSVFEAAAGIKRIVDARMADLLATTTMQRGHDPRDFVMYAFGGAGPTHATSFGLELVDRILVPATHTVHSALGAIASDLSFRFDRSEPMRIARDQPPPAEAIEQVFADLEARAAAALDAQEVPTHQRSLLRWVDIRFLRQTKELKVPWDATGGESAAGRLIEDFTTGYRKLYGTESMPEQAGFEFVTFSMEARGTLTRPRLQAHDLTKNESRASPSGNRSVFDPIVGSSVPASVYIGELLGAGDRLIGPAVLEFDGTTLVVLSGQIAEVDPYLNITVKRGS